MWSFSGEKQVSSFRTTHPSPAFLQLMEELSTVDTLDTPLTAVGQTRKASARRKKSLHGVVSFTETGEGEGGVTDEEGEEQEAELFKDKRKSKQEARRLKKEMRKKEVKIQKCMNLKEAFIICCFCHNQTT